MEREKKKKLREWMQNVIALIEQARTLDGTGGCPQLISLTSSNEVHVSSDDRYHTGRGTIFDLARAVNVKPTITCFDSDGYDFQANVIYRGYKFFALINEEDLKREGIVFEK